MTQKVKMPEPDSYLFQHEETGLIQCVDRQQVEWGFEKINPRWQRIGGMITTNQAEAYAAAKVREALEQAAQSCTNTSMMNVDSYCGATARMCAERIRALLP